MMMEKYPLWVYHVIYWRVRDLPDSQPSEAIPEDIDDSCEQHLVDALRYGLGRKKTRCWVLPVRGI